MRKIVKIIIVFLSIIIASCESESDTSSGGNNSVNGPGTVTFWTASDLGCGNINVVCNGQTRTISSYNSSGAPACGAAGSANFDLPVGSYNYSASCSGKTWSGNISITAGGCLKMQLTGTGGTSGTGGTIGQGTFWTASDLGCGNINVICNGQTRTISSFNSSGAPACGASGSANFDLPAGNYTYTASCSNKNWSGNFTISANTCNKIQLTNSSGSSGTGTGAGTSTILVNKLVAGSSGDKINTSFTVPSGVKTMTVRTTEDAEAYRNTADMGVRRGSVPTVTGVSWVADCFGIKPNREDEVCTFNSPAAGTWNVLLYGYNTYFSSRLIVTITY